MKYKTIIEIVCEGNDKHDALDLAGEYLRGGISSGVTMRCLTQPVHNMKKGALAMILVLLLITGLSLSTFLHARSELNSSSPSYNAIQPPLKTSIAKNEHNSFKENWQDQEVKEALNIIKK